jgi:hypothetical protein
MPSPTRYILLHAYSLLPDFLHLCRHYLEIFNPLIVCSAPYDWSGLVVPRCRLSSVLLHPHPMMRAAGTESHALAVNYIILIVLLVVLYLLWLSL